MRGSCQWQHMMLSCHLGEPNGYQQEAIEIKKAEQSSVAADPPGREMDQQVGLNHWLGKAKPCQVVRHLQAGSRARNASAGQGNDYRLNHEGDRLAATFGPRVLRWRD